MPSTDDIYRQLTGVWQMMTGKPDGIRLLDLSADGFWNSFFAIVVAVPALIVGWVTIANDLGQYPDMFGSKLSILLRLAAVDLAAWIVPLAAFVFAAPLLGIGDRIVHFIVSSNWGTALLVWVTLPPALLRLFMHDGGDFVTLLSLALFGLSLVLTWRLTNAALNTGAAVATAVFLAMTFASLVVPLMLLMLLGLSQPGS